MPAAVALLDVTQTHEGAAVERYALRAGDLAVHVLTAGCAVARIDAPDRAGRVGNVAVGYADVGDYLGPRTEYFGAFVGRVANRIARGRFRLDGRPYRLATNDGPNHLHGGVRGFNRRIWQVVEASSGERARLRLRLVSEDGDEGYPGTLVATVTYTLSPDGELRLDAEATADAPTLVNLTNHSYFNLAGGGDVLDHALQIDADAYCPVDDALIPTGALEPVDGTPFDLRRPTIVGEALKVAHPQLARARGFDHCLALRGWDDALGGARTACVLVDPGSGRRLTVVTDQPGVQLYSGNFLDGTARGEGGARYRRHAGLCLETEHFPDAPNEPRFPSIELRPGERYATATAWRFDVAR